MENESKINIPMWLCHKETISTVIFEVPDHQLLLAIDDNGSFSFILDGIINIIKPLLRENIILSFVKHYRKSTYNVVLSNNNKFLSSHVNRAYTNNCVKISLSQQTFENHMIEITINDVDLQFNLIARDAVSPEYLIIRYYNENI